MQRLRGSWLALFGAMLLVVFSVSVAIGADPETDSNRGRSIASFVHSLIFSDPGAGDEVADEAEDQEEDEDATDDATTEDEDATDDQDAAEAEEATQEGEAGTVSGAEHGACVSEVARSDEVGGPNDNHGGAVSEAARETCWEEEPAEEEATEPETEIVDEFKNHGECVSEVARSDEVGGPNDNHGGAVSEAARETCRENGTTQETSADAAVTADGAQFGSGNGNGHGRGHGNGNGQGHGNKP